MRAELGKYLAKVEAEERAKAEAARRVEAERIRKEQERIAAERAQKMQDDPIAALTEPEPPMPVMPAAPEPVKVQAGGQRGRATDMKPVTTYVVTDYAKALAFIATNEEIVELVNKLAAKAGKAGVPVPGVERREERVAA